MVRYINFKGQAGQVETVDQLDSKDFATVKEFRKELKTLLSEYNLAFNGGCYTSQRASKEYKSKGDK